MILESVFTNLTYWHSDGWGREKSQECFNNLKSSIGALWTCHHLRNEAMPLLAKNLAVTIHRSQDIKRVPLLIRHNAMNIKTELYPHASIDGSTSWTPENYLKVVGPYFPRLQSIACENMEMMAVQAGDNSDLLGCLSGEYDGKIVANKLGYDNIVCGPPTGVPTELQLPFTIEIAVDVNSLRNIYASELLAAARLITMLIVSRAYCSTHTMRRSSNVE